MNNFNELKKQLNSAIKQFENWKLRGYDTPQLTYHEQLDLYKARVDILAKKIKEEMTK